MLLIHPAGSEQRGRQPRHRGRVQRDVARHAAAAQRAAAKDVNAHEHVATGSCRQVFDQLPGRVGLPGVIDEDGVGGVEEGSVQRRDGVLPGQLALDGDRIVPGDANVKHIA